MKIGTILTAACLGLAVVKADAASSDWYETAGGAVRLVTAGPADAEGTLRGVLEIRLDQGWKTYWRDPGDAGIPPQIDVSQSLNVRSVSIAFPAPQRFEDESGKWAGYRGRVALPLRFELIDADAPTLIEAEVFLGICETICIPVQTRFSFDPASDAENPADGLLVTAAHAALPAPADAGFGVTEAAIADGGIAIAAAAPDADATLFVAAPPGWRLLAPERREAPDGGIAFHLPVLDRDDGAEGGRAHFPYTLVTGDGAVSGTFTLP